MLTYVCTRMLRRSGGAIKIERNYKKFSFRSMNPFTAGNTFKEKGLSEENRYFLKKQNQQIKKLRRYMERLDNQQKKLQGKLEETNKLLHDLEETSEKMQNKKQ